MIENLDVIVQIVELRVEPTTKYNTGNLLDKNSGMVTLGYKAMIEKMDKVPVRTPTGVIFFMIIPASFQSVPCADHRHQIYYASPLLLAQQIHDEVP